MPDGSPAPTETKPPQSETQPIDPAPKAEVPRVVTPLSQMPEGTTIPKKTKVQKAKLQESRAKLEEAQRLSMYDQVTGLHNNRWFEERVGNAIKASERSGKGFYVMFMDLDKFKDYNSRYAHAGGDKILRLLRSIRTRPGEDIARYGGDEFAQVLNDDISLEEAVKVSLRNSNTVESESRNVIPQMAIVNADTAPIDHVTMSLGLLECNSQMTYEQIKERASATMLAGKNSGRDLITVSTLDGKTKMFTRDGKEYIPPEQRGKLYRLIAPVQRLLGRKAA